MKKRPSLLFCLFMDLVGWLTYSIPWWGEFGDIFWAPISGLIFFMSFGGRKGAIGGFINFMEELLPFSDFIPTFTIGWFIAGSRQSQAHASGIKTSMAY